MESEMKKERLSVSDYVQKIVNEIADEGYSAGGALGILTKAEALIRKSFDKEYSKLQKTALKKLMRAGKGYSSSQSSGD